MKNRISDKKPYSSGSAVFLCSLCRNNDLTSRRERFNMGGRGSGSGRSGGGSGRQTGPIRLDTMNDAQLSSFVQQAFGGQLPPGFHDDPTQRLIYAAGWNGTPEVVTAAQAEAMARKRGAVALYRTVNDDIGPGRSGKTSSQILDELRTDTTFSTGGWGGQVYGGGVYFSDKMSGSKQYGRRGSNPKTMGAVLNDKAKVVSASDLSGSLGASWVRSHPQAASRLGCSLTASGGVRATAGARTAMAMAMGYNVVKNNAYGREHYYTILDRSALTTSTKDYYPQSKGMKGR